MRQLADSRRLSRKQTRKSFVSFNHCRRKTPSSARKQSRNGLPETGEPVPILWTVEGCSQNGYQVGTYYFALSSSTRAVAKGMTASSKTGVRTASFARYSVKDASFISTPASNTRIAILDAV